jgi:hypothetical protein
VALLFCSALSDERTGLLRFLLGFATAVTLGPKSRRTHGHTLLSHLRLPQPGGPGPHNYILQELSGPVLYPGTGLLSHVVILLYSSKFSTHGTFAMLDICGGVVVKELCYKPEDRGFDTRGGELIFFNLPNPPGRTMPRGSLSL